MCMQYAQTSVYSSYHDYALRYQVKLIVVARRELASYHQYTSLHYSHSGISRSFLLILCSIHQRFYKKSHFCTPTYSLIMKQCGSIICVFCDHNLAFTCSLKRALQMEIFNLCKYLGKLQRKFLQPRKGETNSRVPKDHTKR